MSPSGKWLEHVAREIEERFLPEGWEAQINQRLFDDTGVQIAEFDIVVTGSLGPTPFQWLIECRDRPSRKGAPGSWIEQLIGRKYLFKFDKVTAVSTTGFSKGARGLAALGNIELRSVKTIAVDTIADWFPLSTVELYLMNLKVEHVSFKGIGDNDQVLKKVQDTIISGTTHTKTKMPLHSKTNEPLNIIADFYSRVTNQPHFINSVNMDGNPQRINCVLKYPNPSERYQFATDVGKFHVTEINFEGTLVVGREVMPIAQVTEYQKTSTSEPIAQSVRFTAKLDKDRNIDLYFHNLGEEDKTFISARVLMTE